MTDFALARRNMVEGQLRPNRVTSVPLLEAIGDMPREQFLADALRSVAYADDDVPVGGGRFLMEPMVLARMIQALQPNDGQGALVVASGCGYGAALLGRLVKSLVNPSLRVEEFSNQTVIDGMLDSPGELKRLRALVGDDANVTILARLDPRVLPAVAQNITAALHREGLSNAHAACLGQTLVLEGSVADERELQKAQMIADSYAGDLLRH